MLSFTGSRDLYGKFTQDTKSLGHGDTLLNLAIREILGKADWDFMEKTNTQSTVASQRFYDLPGDYESMIDGPYVLIDSTRYTPTEVPNRKFWDNLNRQEDHASDFPEWYFIFDGQLGLYPKPNTSNTNALIIPYKKGFADLSIADYTTGKVDVITNGSTTVDGASSPAWTSPMAGRFLKVTPTNVATTSGDGIWYEIASRTDADTLELKRKYLGTSLTTGAAAAYIIGEMSPLPETYHILPVLKAAEQYWLPKGDKRAGTFAQRYEILLKQMTKDFGTKTTSPVIDDGQETNIINPNLTVSL